MRKVLDEADKTKKGGKKKGGKVGPSEPAPSLKKGGKRKSDAEPSKPKRKRVKKMARQPRTPTLSDQEDS